MGTMISLKQLQALATAYGEALNTSVRLFIAAWLFKPTNHEELQFQLYVESTREIYEYDTAEEMIAAVRMKTLLHKKWSI